MELDDPRSRPLLGFKGACDLKRRSAPSWLSIKSLLVVRVNLRLAHALDTDATLAWSGYQFQRHTLARAASEALMANFTWSECAVIAIVALVSARPNRSCYRMTR